jgi:hypothetical protein
MKRRDLQRERELLNLEKLANAKRSSRIAHKVERKKKEVEEEEEERHRLDAERAEHKKRLASLKFEQERDFRMFARQRRLNERESRRIRHEAELFQLSENSKIAPEAARISERRLQNEIQRNQQALKDIEQEDEDWVFDCICGLYGQVDDGTHSVACERCNVWQHSKCLGISEDEADQSQFHFVCSSCRRREDEKNKSPKTIIKIKVRPSNNTTVATAGVEGNMVSELKHGSITKGDHDRSIKEWSSTMPRSESQCVQLDTVPNEAPSQATFLQPCGNHEPHMVSSASAATEPLTNLCSERSLVTSGHGAPSETPALTAANSPPAKHSITGHSQFRLGLPRDDTKVPEDVGEALGPLSHSEPSACESSTMTINRNSWSASTQQSSTILTSLSVTKNSPRMHNNAHMETSSSATVALPPIEMPRHVTQDIVSSPARLTDQD